MILLRDVFELRAMILKRGTNYAEFAREIGMSRSHLNKTFTRKRVSADVAKRISERLGVAFDDIFLIQKCPYDHENVV